MVNSPTDGLSDEERLLRQAIDDAFVQCITRLMANWMSGDYCCRRACAEHHGSIGAVECMARI